MKLSGARVGPAAKDFLINQRVMNSAQVIDNRFVVDLTVRTILSSQEQAERAEGSVRDRMNARKDWQLAFGLEEQPERIARDDSRLRFVRFNFHEFQRDHLAAGTWCLKISADVWFESFFPETQNRVSQDFIRKWVTGFKSLGQH